MGKGYICVKSPDFFLRKLTLSLSVCIEKPLNIRISQSFRGFVNNFSVFSFASFKFIHIFAFEIIPYEIAAVCQVIVYTFGLLNCKKINLLFDL